MLATLPGEIQTKPLLKGKLVPFDILLSTAEWGKRWAEVISAAKDLDGLCAGIDKVCQFPVDADVLSIADRVAALAHMQGAGALAGSE